VLEVVNPAPGTSSQQFRRTIGAFAIGIERDMNGVR
jgi:hypothetical protein